MKHLIKALALLLLPALLVGCTGNMEIAGEGILPAQSSASSTPVEEPVGLPAALSLPYYPSQSLDPVTCSDGVQQTVSSLLCEGLFELDATFAPQPRLCVSYVYDPSAYVYIFTLRPAVLFSDGSALTAADVADTLNRARSSARYGARLSAVTSVTAGEGTVTVALSSANTGLPTLLDIPIVKLGTADTAPVGTGPYGLVSSGETSSLIANSHWWQGGGQPVDHILLKAAKDPDTMLYQFTSHETQLLTADLTGTNPVSVTGSIGFYEADSTVFQYVGINAANSILSDAALRRALSLGIDREQMVSAFFSGHAKAAQFPVSPALAEYPDALEKSYSYDAFRRAMTDAGFSTGNSTALTMIVNGENSFKVAAARHIASALSAFDLKIDVSVLPWASYTAALRGGDFDLYYGEVKLTADWDLRALLSTGGSLNYTRSADPMLDGLLGAFPSSDNRAAAMLGVCRRLQAQAPILPVCFKTVSVLVQEGVVENLSPTAANPFFNLSGCAVHLEPDA